MNLHNDADPKGCPDCRHLKSDKMPYYCAAFPDKIPMVIASGDIFHDTVIPGQNGKTVFQPK